MTENDTPVSYSLAAVFMLTLSCLISRENAFSIHALVHLPRLPLWMIDLFLSLYIVALNQMRTLQAKVIIPYFRVEDSHDG